MKKFIKYIIKKFLSLPKEDILMLGVVILSMVAGVYMGAGMTNNIKLYKHNLQVATDSLRIIKDKNGELMAEREVYIVKNKDLKQTNKALYEENNRLKKTIKEKLYYISKVETKIKIDTVQTTVTVHDTISNIPFRYKSKWFNISGTVYPTNHNLKLYDINIPVPLTIGLTKSNKMVITSKNPYITIESIDGAYLFDNQSKLLQQATSSRANRFNHGLLFGIGANYGMVKRKWDVGPFVGYGFVWRF